MDCVNYNASPFNHLQKQPLDIFVIIQQSSDSQTISCCISWEIVERLVVEVLSK